MLFRSRKTIPTIANLLPELKSEAPTLMVNESCPGKSDELKRAKALRFELGTQRFSRVSSAGLADAFMGGGIHGKRASGNPSPVGLAGLAIFSELIKNVEKKCR